MKDVLKYNLMPQVKDKIIKERKKKICCILCVCLSKTFKKKVLFVTKLQLEVLSSFFNM